MFRSWSNALPAWGWDPAKAVFPVTICPCLWPNTRHPQHAEANDGASAAGAHLHCHVCRLQPPHVQTHPAARFPESRRRHLPQHRRLAAGPLLFRRFRLQGRDPQRAQQRGHAGRFHPGQVPHSRTRCPQRPAAGVRVGHAQGQRRPHQILGHVQRRRLRHRRRRGGQAG